MELFVEPSLQDLLPVLPEKVLTYIATHTRDFSTQQEKAYHIYSDVADALFIEPARVVGYWYIARLDIKSGIVRAPEHEVAGSRIPYAIDELGYKFHEPRLLIKDSIRRNYNQWTVKKTKKESTPQDVYFIQGEYGGPIKIGIANDIQSRLASHQTGSPVILRIVGISSNGGKKLESKLHKQFADIRLHGEWFEATPELLSYIHGGCAESDA